MYVRIHVGSVLDYVSRYLLSMVMYSVSEVIFLSITSHNLKIACPANKSLSQWSVAVKAWPITASYGRSIFSESQFVSETPPKEMQTKDLTKGKKLVNLPQCPYYHGRSLTPPGVPLIFQEIYEISLIFQKSESIHWNHHNMWRLLYMLMYD